ncbi:MAG: hypothetical protein ABSD41_08480 [Candidatus Bathyarchaeia archaeon]
MLRKVVQVKELALDPANREEVESVELRDGRSRYARRGVLRAKNVNETIGTRLKGVDVRRQIEMESTTAELDGRGKSPDLGTPP